MTWAEACEAMTQGKKVRLSWWEKGKGMGIHPRWKSLYWHSNKEFGFGVEVMATFLTASDWEFAE